MSWCSVVPTTSLVLEMPWAHKVKIHQSVTVYDELSSMDLYEYYLPFLQDAPTGTACWQVLRS